VFDLKNTIKLRSIPIKTKKNLRIIFKYYDLITPNKVKWNLFKFSIKSNIKKLLLQYIKKKTLRILVLPVYFLERECGQD